MATYQPPNYACFKRFLALILCQLVSLKIILWQHFNLFQGLSKYSALNWTNLGNLWYINKLISSYTLTQLEILNETRGSLLP